MYDTDLPAVRFFVELAQYEGFQGEGISDAKLLLDVHTAEVSSGLALSQVL